MNILKTFQNENINFEELKNICDSQGIEFAYRGNEVLIIGESFLDFEIPIKESISEPRIKAFQIDKNKDFRAVDLNNEVTVTFDIKEVLGIAQADRGILLKKEYSYNQIPILDIEYEWQLNSIEELWKQRPVLKWYNEDGSINQLIKDKGWKTFNSKERTESTIKRREAIIGQLREAIKTMMSQNATNDTELNASINYGNQLIAHVSIEIDTFTKSGKLNSLITKLDNSTAAFPFLLNQLAPGYTVINHIHDFLNY
jgi:hypothetical protein